MADRHGPGLFGGPTPASSAAQDLPCPPPGLQVQGGDATATRPHAHPPERGGGGQCEGPNNAGPPVLPRAPTPNYSTRCPSTAPAALTHPLFDPGTPAPGLGRPSPAPHPPPACPPPPPFGGARGSAVLWGTPPRPLQRLDPAQKPRVLIIQRPTGWRCIRLPDPCLTRLRTVPCSWLWGVPLCLDWHSALAIGGARGRSRGFGDWSTHRPACPPNAHVRTVFCENRIVRWTRGMAGAHPRVDHFKCECTARPRSVFGGQPRPPAPQLLLRL